MDSWSRGRKAELVRCNLSYFIFPQRGAISLDKLQQGEKKKRELKLKNFILQGL